MTSLYNLIAGENPYSRMALAVLDMGINQIPRYQDAAFAWPDDTSDVWRVLLLTRTGCANRFVQDDAGEQVDANAVLTSHPLYLSDHALAADPTYAMFYFRFPDELSGLGTWIARTEPLEGDARIDAWVSLFNKLNNLKVAYPDSRWVLSMKKWIAPVMQVMVDEGNIDVKDVS